MEKDRVRAAEAGWGFADNRALSVVWLRILAPFLAERERWVLWLPVFFGIGIGVYFALPVEPPVWAGLSGLGFVAILAMAGRFTPGVLIPCFAMGLIAGGFTAAQVRTWTVTAPILSEETGAVEIMGRVQAVEARDRGVRLRIAASGIEGVAETETPAVVRVTVANGAPGIAAGDRVKALAILRPPPSPVAPGAFDFARRAFFDRIGAVGFVLGDVTALPGAPVATPVERFWQAIARIRHSLAERVRAHLPGDTGAVAAALMTGERGGVSDASLTAMRHAGLAHLLAISGLHVGLVAGLVFFVVRGVCALIPPVVLRWPVKKWAAAAAFLGAGVYLLLAGATVPTQRAFLMTAVVLLGVALDRTAVSMRLVSWAALGILIVRPESLLSVSFQMSFAAVTALVAVYETLRRQGLFRPDRSRLLVRFAVYFGSVALTSTVAALATAPFAIYHFNRLALYGLAANMLAVPTMAFWVMPWILAVFALAPFGLDWAALVPVGWGLEAILAIARTVAAWPGAAPLVPAPPLAGLMIVAAGGLWLCLWSRPWRLSGLVPVLLGAGSLLAAPTPDLLIGRDPAQRAIRDAKGDLVLSAAAEGSFSADIWLRRNGQMAAATIPARAAASGAELRCDALGCIYRSGPHTLALVSDARALAEDCAEATILVASVPVERHACAMPLVVIDRFDVLREGAHAVYAGTGRPTVETVRDTRGQRPWVRPESFTGTAQ